MYLVCPDMINIGLFSQDTAAVCNALTTMTSIITLNQSFFTGPNQYWDNPVSRCVVCFARSQALLHCIYYHVVYTASREHSGKVVMRVLVRVCVFKILNIMRCWSYWDRLYGLKTILKTFLFCFKIVKPKILFLNFKYYACGRVVCVYVCLCVCVLCAVVFFVCVCKICLLIAISGYRIGSYASCSSPPLPARVRSPRYVTRRHLIGHGSSYPICVSREKLSTHFTSVKWQFVWYTLSFNFTVKKHHKKKGTAAIPPFVFSHGKATTHCTPFKWWFVTAGYVPVVLYAPQQTPALCGSLAAAQGADERRYKHPLGRCHATVGFPLC